MKAGNVVDIINQKDVFATSIEQIENLGSCSRFTFCVESTAPGATIPDKLAVVKLVIPHDKLSAILKTTALYLSETNGGVRPVMRMH